MCNALIKWSQCKSLYEKVKNHEGGPKILTIAISSEQHFLQYDAEQLMSYSLSSEY